MIVLRGVCPLGVGSKLVTGSSATAAAVAVPVALWLGVGVVLLGAGVLAVLLSDELGLCAGASSFVCSCGELGADVLFVVLPCLLHTWQL